MSRLEAASAGHKPVAGGALPSLPITTLDGSVLDLAAIGGWRMLVVYRGRHCPICKSFLGTLDGLLGEFTEAGIRVLAVSADKRERAAADVAEHGWRFAVGYDLGLAQMHALGLYVSAPLADDAAEQPFPEPALLVVNPEGRLHIVDIANSPFVRPDLALVLRGIRYSQEHGYPVRGTLT